ncbi:undecaprenyldiphospho-muramoylpentapeptide beta-N-acetylglucosaminyltransferase [Ancylomarina euxinus]|uniref:UDP-N-acetylglucosamine--N-acetylmuramyl-(pentapeptide) pyrophosphoryl-undecaprenol N-acetylglucosamine transferase n=1 Tax=Ancylomarina euxinus TaxID=2283627 RepID=A0A425Y102_9BACT|nr:undecaprenyldiphospho-muramoylpentapeptide beta-N-acetylglucosaminyltransferase [Ancylomarina euxinus]MCZ4693825.1 undecaprenyldiphospho-muramoylpentapeptide beta-N-acetylglucosaminyltransferase [Ancylomarina euxinus]MUP15096.1 undecaprenyldiphospho-muramoylpentapeptide beta-N-acetylglucosaminyltransferase [Ancylomarina euxinus]RRG21519.1 undecaprenyldiphospho-muramoylpentapeptide beta-N-acetylglucosaminyltransferase [Ancylomarina euxinus]
MRKIKIIVSGGGTGGHIFPAISIANALKAKQDDIEILFVGADGKMEMEKVPAAGYKIIGLPIRGLQRNFNKENLKFFSRLFRSLRKAKKIIKEFKPDAVVGVGGYASGPLLHAANKMGIPSLIQEQNSYAGITNKLLAKKADKICVAYQGMERFFPADKILMTGNPVRKDLIQLENLRAEAQFFFNLNPNKKTLLVIGGSLGARTINHSIIENIEDFKDKPIQVIWQSGKFYHQEMKEKLAKANIDNVQVSDFLTRMDLAYAASDLVISRAGAGTISELCMVKKACILVPSPNVSEDHQTKNAMALVHQDAAMMIPDIEAKERLVKEALLLLDNDSELEKLEKNIALLAKPNAADEIADEILKMIKQ